MYFASFRLFYTLSSDISLRIVRSCYFRNSSRKATLFLTAKVNVACNILAKPHLLLHLSVETGNRVWIMIIDVIPRYRFSNKFVTTYTFTVWSGIGYSTGHLPTDNYQSLIWKRLKSIFVHLRYVQLKLPRNKENNKNKKIFFSTAFIFI